MAGVVMFVGMTPPCKPACTIQLPGYSSALSPRLLPRVTLCFFFFPGPHSLVLLCGVDGEEAVGPFYSLFSYVPLLYLHILSPRTMRRRSGALYDYLEEEDVYMRHCLSLASLQLTFSPLYSSPCGSFHRYVCCVSISLWFCSL